MDSSRRIAPRSSALQGCGGLAEPVERTLPFVDMDMPEIPAPAARADASPAIGRRVLGAGLAGLAASLLPALRGRAAASTDTTDPPVTVVPEQPTPDETDGSTVSSEAATTTTEPRRRPSAADEPMLGFSQQVEAAIVEMYDRALTAGSLDDTARTVLTTIRESHQAYGHASSALLGQAAPRGGSIDVPEIAELAVDGSMQAIAESAVQAEAIAIATHTEVIGQLEGTDGARQLASMVTMASRHCVVLNELAGRTGLDALEIPDVQALEMAAG